MEHSNTKNIEYLLPAFIALSFANEEDKVIVEEFLQKPKDEKRKKYYKTILLNEKKQEVYLIDSRFFLILSEDSDNIFVADILHVKLAEKYTVKERA